MRVSLLLGACALSVATASSFAEGTAHAQPAPATPDALANARLHFAAGVNLLRDPAKPRYEEAYREFKTAYGLSPAVQILGNLGLCAMMLERDAEAIDAYESYLKGMMDVAPAEREQIERDLQTLKLGVARLKVTSNVAGTSIIDRRVPTQGDPVNNVYGPVQPSAPLPLGVRQGHHVFTARAPGRTEQTWEVDASAGDLGTHAFVFADDRPVLAGPLAPAAPPPPPPERPIPRSFWYGVGATSALGAATAVTGILALGTASSYDDANRGRTPERADELRSRGQAFNVTTDVLLGTTIIAAAVTAYLYVTRPEKEASSLTAFLRTAR